MLLPHSPLVSPLAKHIMPHQILKMKTKDILIITAIAAVGWYFYRTSKGLPLFPFAVATAPGTTPTTATGTAAPVNPVTTVTGDVTAILGALTTGARDLGISATSTPDTTNSGLDDLTNTL